MKVTGRTLVWAAACTLLGACQRDFSIPSAESLTPVLSLERVSPEVAGAGTTVRATVSSSRVLEACEGQLGALTFDGCQLDANGRGCICQHLVTSALDSGRISIGITGRTASGAESTVTGGLEVDVDAPVVDPSRLTWVGGALGTEDALRGAAGAVTDPAPTYEGQRIVRLRVSDDAHAPLLEIVPDADGGFAAQALPGTSRTAPPALFLSAEDAAGNVSDPVSLALGGDGPARTLAGTVAIQRRPLGTPDAVRVEAAAFEGALAVVRVRLWDAADAETPLGEAALDGEAVEVPVGSGEAAPARVWISAEDKAGRTSSRSEIAAGADLEPPRLDPTRLALGPGPKVEGRAGAVTDATSAVARVRVFGDAPGGTLLGSAVPSADGAFGPLTLPGSPTTLVLEVVDKTGQRSPPVTVRLLDPASDAASVIPFTSPLAPQDAAPGLAATRAAAVGPGEAGALTAADGDALEVRAVAVAQDVAPAWRRLTLPPLPGDPHLVGDPGGLLAVAGWGGGASLSVGALRLDGAWQPVSAAGITEAPQACARDAGRAAPVCFGYYGEYQGYDSWVQSAGAWAFEGGAWTSTGSPPRRHRPALAYDEIRGVLVLFGGIAYSGYGEPSETATTAELGSAWTVRSPPAAPPPRHDAAMAWDGNLGRVLVFGGTDGSTNRADLWSWDGTTWRSITRTPSPSARVASMAWDPVARQVLLFGGSEGSGALEATWTFDGSAWTPVPTAHRPPLSSEVAFDPRLGKVVAFQYGETWTFEGTDWRRLRLDAGPSTTGAGWVWDAARHRMVVAGGRLLTAPFLDAWSHGDDGWRLDTSDGPATAAGVGASVHWDPYDRRVSIESEAGRLVVEGTGWTAPDGLALPETLTSAAFAFDTSRRRRVAFGGDNGVAFSDATWARSSAGWAPLTTTGAPPPRMAGALAYDPVRDRLVLFGGLGGGPSASTALNDTWELVGGRWQAVPTSAAPSPRYGASLTYDARLGAMVLFGGRDASQAMDDLWLYDGTDWAEVTPAASEAPGVRFGAGLSPRAEDLVLLGGTGLDGSVRPARPTSLDDAWALAMARRGASTAAQSVLFEVPLHPMPSALSLSLVGTGLGDADGDDQPDPGLELFVWDWEAGAWTQLGAHAAAPGDPAADRTLRAVISQDLPRYLLDGRLWVLAAASHPAEPDGSVESVVAIDALTLAVIE